MTTAQSKLNLSGYRLTEQVYNGSKSVVYRAETIPKMAEEKSQLIVIKSLASQFPSCQDLLKIRHQYAITKDFAHPGIIRPQGIEEYQHGYALVMPDVGGISLDRYCQNQPLSLSEVLHLAIQLADILQELCQQQIIHKDIKPANILIHPETKQVWLIDFSIASRLSWETQEILSPNLLEGTLAYISPEQTGRMNRGIDYRSDFYSLGVTLYELLTGQLPFADDEAIKLVHSHLAKGAVPVNTINPSIPAMVAQIVAKLMAKNAEGRYQNTLGLKHDLEKCLQQWQTTGSVDDFPLGLRDLGQHFLIPEKLYGRETEIQTLLAAFNRINQGHTEIMLVAGFSGVGKTAVVNEVHKPITRQQGYFIKGKFDQFNRNIPLSAFVQAFQDLIDQLLSESNTQLIVWQKKILAAVSDNGQAIVAMIPKLERIIGQQPPLPELSGSAEQNRFNLTFQKFIKVFSTPEHPLVVFLDDLQWADTASLQLLQTLTQDASHLLIVGAYRDNEVWPGHPLLLMIKELEKTGIGINTIELQPLGQSDINQLVADTLSCDLRLARPLSELVHQKTQGNPFFSTQFLKVLHQDGFIQFNPTTGYWQCDISQVKLHSLTEDVVKFMAQQLQKLSPATQNCLELAACIGAQFDLQTLAMVSEQPESKIAAALWPALQYGLIIPLNQIYKFFQGESELGTEHPSNLKLFDSGACTYRFLHDRVQQAAYSLIPNNQKEAVHLHIGRLLMAQISRHDWDLHLFQIVNQLNQGIRLIAEPEERAELAQLNWQAGAKARAAAAYDTASSYLTKGLQLLSASCWQDRYGLSLSLHQLAAEVAYLSGEYDRMAALVTIGLQQAHNHLDKTKFHEIQILSRVAQNQAREAVQYAQNILPNYGVRFPNHPSPLNTALGFLATLWRMGGKTPQDLLALPLMSAPTPLAACQLINSIGAAAQRGMPDMLPFVTFNGIALYLRYGNIPKSSMGYIIYAFLLCEKLGQVDKGYAMGKAAITLCHQTGSKEALAPTLFLWNRFVSYRKESLHTSLPELLEAYQVSLEVGDTEYAAYSLSAYFGQAYMTGQNLLELKQEAIAAHSAFNKLQQNSIAELHNSFCQSLEALTQPSATAADTINRFIESSLSSDSYQNERVYTHLRKLEISLVFHRYDQAAEHIKIVEKLLGKIDGTYPKTNFYFYAALVSLAQYDRLDKIRQKTQLQKAQAACRSLARHAKSAPVNYQHKVFILKAELMRVTGKFLAAGEFYDKAIAAAHAHGYIQDKALNNELAARFYFASDRPQLAAGYLREAYYSYALWGATTKTAELEETYPQYLAPAPLLGTQFSSHGTVTLNHSLDFTSAFKVAQTLTEEIVLEQLLLKLMQVVLTTAGANKGVLLLPHNHEMTVAAIATHDAESDQTVLQPLTQLDLSQQVPLTIVHSICHQRDPLILDTPQLIPTYLADPYWQHHPVCSVLCVPLLKQGQIKGLVYLENQLTTGAFTSDRIEILTLLCNQAAIALENAQLYQTLQQTNQSLELSNQELLRATCLKDEFLATMSHELRTPLNAILGMSEALQEEIFGSLNEKQMKSILTIERSGRHLLSLINDILDVSKIAAGKLELDISSVSVSNLCHSSLTFIKQQAHTKQIQLEIKVPPTTDYIAVDERRMRQVLINLLSNAVKFTPAGGHVSLEVTRTPLGETLANAGAIEFVITDTGIGIANSDRDKLFQPFVQLDGKLNRQHEGTGLGLTLVKQIVELHGGSVSLHSQLGQGSCFTVNLPQPNTTMPPS